MRNRARRHDGRNQLRSHVPCGHLRTVHWPESWHRHRCSYDHHHWRYPRSRYSGASYSGACYSHRWLLNRRRCCREHACTCRVRYPHDDSQRVDGHYRPRHHSPRGYGCRTWRCVHGADGRHSAAGAVHDRKRTGRFHEQREHRPRSWNTTERARCNVAGCCGRADDVVEYTGEWDGDAVDRWLNGHALHRWSGECEDIDQWSGCCGCDGFGCFVVSLRSIMRALMGVLRSTMVYERKIWLHVCP